MHARTISLLALFAFAVFVPATQSASAARPASSSVGSVYVMTNEAADNAVIQFHRGKDGSLIQGPRVSTGGLGSGGTLDPLGSQDSLVLAGNGSSILAVNAGSDEISVLGVAHDGLSLLSKVASGGDFPNSVAIHDDLVYVLNAKTAPNVTGFRLLSGGLLEPIPASTRNLPGGAASAPADIHFSPDGTRLLVTETATNQIDIFDIGDDGLAGEPVTRPSNGMTPFGFRFGHGGVVIVAEAGSGAVSSYRLEGEDALDVISGSVANGQMASCWISLTSAARYAYVSNTASNTLSSYAVDSRGTLTLLNAVAAGTTTPTDSALSSDSKFFYVLNSTLGAIAIYRADGASLTSLGAVSGLPTSLQGIAAR
jgi:6-phosphogluconolactonase